MSGISQRKVPRRNFKSTIAILHKGKYVLSRSLQVGEGGIGFVTGAPLKIFDRVVVTFHVPRGSTIVVQGEIRYVNQNADHTWGAGVQFSGLNFHYMRELRNFVARANQEEIFG